MNSRQRLCDLRPGWCLCTVQRHILKRSTIIMCHFSWVYLRWEWWWKIMKVYWEVKYVYLTSIHEHLITASVPWKTRLTLSQDGLQLLLTPACPTGLSGGYLNVGSISMEFRGPLFSGKKQAVSHSRHLYGPLAFQALPVHSQMRS